MLLKRLSPAVWALFGASWSYYGLVFLMSRPCPWSAAVWISSCVLLAAQAFFQTLSYLPLRFYRDHRQRREFRRFRLWVTALVLGFALGLAARGNVSRGIQTGIPQDAVTGFTGVLGEDLRLFSGGGTAYLDLETTAGNGGIRCSARGRILVFFPESPVSRLKSFGRGCGVYIEGKFVSSKQKPGEPLFRAARAYILDEAPAVERFRTGIRRRVLEGLTDPRWGGLAQALLLGVKDNLDTDLARSFREAGCAHILALSGMHLAVLSGCLAFLLKRPLGLKGAAVAGAVFIILYTALVGAQPSLERAAIMYLLGTLTVLAALPRNTLSILALAFLLQLAFRPASGDSLSFILSYLALGGILTLGEALFDLVRGTIPDFLARPLSASLGAFIATAAVVSASFGTLHPAGILAGLIIAPLSTAFMIAALIHLALFPLVPALAGPVGTALAFMYTALSRLTGAAGRLPALNTASPAAVLGAVLGAAVFIWIAYWRMIPPRLCAASLRNGGWECGNATVKTSSSTPWPASGS